MKLVVSFIFFIFLSSISTTTATQLFASDTTSCASNNSLQLVTVEMNCDADGDGDVTDDYTFDEAAAAAADDNYNNDNNNYNLRRELQYDDDDFYGFNGNQNNGQQQMDDNQNYKTNKNGCKFGDTAQIVGTLEITEDLDTEMYVTVNANLYGFSKTLINKENICDLDGLTATSQDIRCPEVGFYQFTETYTIPDTDFGWITSGMSVKVTAYFTDDSNSQIGCSTAKLSAVKDADQSISGIGIVMFAVATVVLCCGACCSLACGQSRTEYHLKRIPLVTPRAYASSSSATSQKVQQHMINTFEKPHVLSVPATATRAHHGYNQYY